MNLCDVSCVICVTRPNSSYRNSKYDLFLNLTIPWPFQNVNNCPEVMICYNIWSVCQQASFWKSNWTLHVTYKCYMLSFLKMCCMFGVGQYIDISVQQSITSPCSTLLSWRLTNINLFIKHAGALRHHFLTHYDINLCKLYLHRL